MIHSLEAIWPHQLIQCSTILNLWSSRVDYRRCCCTSHRSLPHSVVLIQLYVNLVPLLWPCDNCRGQRPSRPYLNLIQNSDGGLSADIFSRTIPLYRFPTARHCHLVLDLTFCTFVEQRITINILLRSLTIPTDCFKGKESAPFISGSYPEYHTADTTQKDALFPIWAPQVCADIQKKSLKIGLLV
jgi:hypothetical protein